MTRLAAVLKAGTAVVCAYEAAAIATRRTTISEYVGASRHGVAVAVGCCAGLAVHFALGRRACCCG